jgi:hypothetical protein
MATMDVEQAAVTIPAAYLDDVRSALVDEIESDTGALTSNQAALLVDNVAFHRVDRDSSVKTLSEDLQMLGQLLDATGDTALHGQPYTLGHVFEMTVRVLCRRLKDVCQYGPLPMGDVVELSARLRWAADEAIRIYPELADRLSDDEAVA